jgi:hypothetical protein
MGKFFRNKHFLAKYCFAPSHLCTIKSAKVFLLRIVIDIKKERNSMNRLLLRFALLVCMVGAIGMVSGCGPKKKKGIVVGALLGAGIGAGVGAVVATAGSAGTGAAVGAGVGTVAGAGVGAAVSDDASMSCDKENDCCDTCKKRD